MLSLFQTRHPEAKKGETHKQILQRFLSRRALWASSRDPFVNASKLHRVFQQEHGGFWSGLRARVSDLAQDGLVISRRGKNKMQEYALCEFIQPEA